MSDYRTLEDSEPVLNEPAENEERDNPLETQHGQPSSLSTIQEATTNQFRYEKFKSKSVILGLLKSFVITFAILGIDALHKKVAASFLFVVAILVMLWSTICAKSMGHENSPINQVDHMVIILRTLGELLNMGFFIILGLIYFGYGDEQLKFFPKSYLFLLIPVFLKGFGWFIIICTIVVLFFSWAFKPAGDEATELSFLLSSFFMIFVWYLFNYLIHLSFFFMLANKLDGTLKIHWMVVFIPAIIYFATYLFISICKLFDCANIGFYVIITPIFELLSLIGVIIMGLTIPYPSVPIITYTFPYIFLFGIYSYDLRLRGRPKITKPADSLSGGIHEPLQDVGPDV